MALRSTKVASKVRRAAMGDELASLRRIVPISQTAKRRLSQIQLMSIATAYIAKSTRLSPFVSHADSPSIDAMNYNFEEALPGFILATTAEGRLLYISENVSKYLGYTTMDLLTHNDTVYDVTDPRDHSKIRSIFDRSSPSYSVDSSCHVTTSCRFTMARSLRRQAGCHRNKELKVRGRFVDVRQTELSGGDDSYQLFIAMCYSDVISTGTCRVSASMAVTQCYNTMAFHSQHGLDMKYISVQANGESHLGCNQGELIGRSWYERIHPDDVENARNKHREVITQLVIREATCTLNARLQTQFGHFIGVRMEMRLQKNSQRAAAKQSRLAKQSTDDVIIHVTNYVMDEITARAVFDLGSTVSGYPSSYSTPAGPSFASGRSRGGKKRKMLDIDVEGARSFVENPAQPAGPPVHRVKSECDKETAPQQVPGLTTESFGRADGLLKNAFPLLASRILSPPAVGQDIRNSEEIPTPYHAHTLTRVLVVPDEYMKFLPVVISASKDDQSLTDCSVSTFDAAASQQSPGCADSVTSRTSDVTTSSFYDELWTSPDSTLSPDSRFELADTDTAGSSGYSKRGVADNASCDTPYGEENDITSMLSDFGDKALDQIMEDFNFQADMSTIDMATESSAKRESAEIVEMSSPDQTQQPVVSIASFVKPDGALFNEEEANAVTSSDGDRSGRLRDLLAVYQNVVTLAVAELVKNQVTSRLVHNASKMSPQTSAKTPSPLYLPSSLSQLDQLMGKSTSSGASESSSNVLLKALALNDLTTELLTLLNSGENGGSVAMSSPQQDGDFRLAFEPTKLL